MKKGLVTALIGAAAYCAGVVFLPWQHYELARLSVGALEVHPLAAISIALALVLAGIAGWGIATGRKVVAARAMLGGGLVLVGWLVAAVLERTWGLHLMSDESVSMGVGFVVALGGALMVFGGSGTALAYAPRWDEETPVLRIRATPDDPRSPAREVIVYEPRVIDLGRELGLSVGGGRAELTSECELRLSVAGARVTLEGDGRWSSRGTIDRMTLAMGQRAAVGIDGVELHFDYVRQPRHGTRKLVLGSEAVAAALVVLLVFLALGVGTILGWDEDATRILPDVDRRTATIAALTEEERQNEPALPTVIDTALLETQQSTRAAGGPEGKVGDAEAPPDRPTKIPPRRGARIFSGVDVREVGLLEQLNDPHRNDALADILSPDGNFSARLAGMMDGSDSTFSLGPGTNGLSFSGDDTGGPGQNGPGGLLSMGDIDSGPGPGNVAVALQPRERRKVPTVQTPIGTTSGDFCKKSDIASAVARRAAGSIRSCYEQRLVVNESLKGKITVRWMIGLDGKVMSADAVADSLGDTQTTQCVLRAVRNIKFPAPDGGTCVVSWPFVFNPG